MKKFFILYKDETVIEGHVDCDEKTFEENLILPCKDKIHSFHIFKPVEELTQEAINELL